VAAEEADPAADPGAHPGADPADQRRAPADSPRAADRRSRAPLIAGLAGLALAALLAPSEPLPLPILWRWLAAFLLFVLLPGWLLIGLLLPSLGLRAAQRLETAILVLAAGYGLAVLLGLALHALFRPIAPWQLAAGGELLVLALAVAAGCRRARLPFLPATADLPPLSDARAGGRGAEGRLLSQVWPVLLLLAFAVPLRLFDLGWSEFQGDEARVVLRAMAALQGADGALAAHRKVPGEILLTYLFAGSLGQIAEHVARLPFALAGVGAVLAFYSLARLLLGGPAALVAGLLLAVNGYFVAFGRLLQYDSLAFFLGIAGLLCCWRFGRAGPDDPDDPGHPEHDPEHDGAPLARPVAWALLGALLLGGAALVALGAVFLVPPALLLIWPGLVRYRRSWRVLAAWAWPVVPGLLAAALVLGGGGEPVEGPSGIWSYLGPRLGGDRPYWHGLELLLSANHYLSSPYLLVMLGAGAFACLLGLLAVARGAGGRGIVLRLGLALVLAVLTWDRPRAALVLGAVLVLLLVLRAPGQRLGMRVALLWVAGPLLAHLFLIRVPGTHWREVFPGLILVLAALAGPALADRRWRWPVGALVGLLVVGAGHYAWVTLVQRLPEYQLTYPANRHPLDWANRDGRGIGGLFGAVHHHGWKALGVLMAEGAFNGGYATNESPAVAAWYLRRPQGCEGALSYVFRVQRAPQDRNLILPVPLPAGYQTRGQVRVRGRSTLAVQLPPGTTTRLGDIPAEPYEERFDRELASAWGPVGELYRADLGAAAARRACASALTPNVSP
jgi:4-amino-4-deoxy-L-arabinose transferase-like glycosyltransferase